MILEEYLHGALGGIAAQLGWSLEIGSYDFIIAATLESYGVSTEAEATDHKKLHALGMVELWKAVLTEVSFDFDFSADGSSYSRGKVFEMIKEKLSNALTEALPYQSSYVVEFGDLDNRG